jgi:hypothetical protein
MLDAAWKMLKAPKAASTNTPIMHVDNEKPHIESKMTAKLFRMAQFDMSVPIDVHATDASKVAPNVTVAAPAARFAPVPMEVTLSR